MIPELDFELIRYTLLEKIDFCEICAQHYEQYKQKLIFLCVIRNHLQVYIILFAHKNFA